MCLIAHDESDFACAHDIIDFMYGLTLALSYLLCLFDNSVDLVDIPAARIAIVYQYTEGENTLDYRRIKQMRRVFGIRVLLLFTATSHKVCMYVCILFGGIH